MSPAPTTPPAGAPPPWARYAFDYTGWRYPAYAFSVAILVAVFLVTFARGGINWGLDFVGGTSVIVKFREDVTTDFLSRIREGLGDLGRNIRTIGATGEEKREISVDIRGGGYVDGQVARFLEARAAGNLASPADLDRLFEGEPERFRRLLVDYFATAPAGAAAAETPAAETAAARASDGGSSLYDLSTATPGDVREVFQTLFNEGIASKVRDRLSQTFAPEAAGRPDVNEGDAVSLGRALAALRAEACAARAAESGPHASLEAFLSASGLAEVPPEAAAAALAVETGVPGRTSVNAPAADVAAALRPALERAYAGAVAAVTSARDASPDAFFASVDDAARAAEGAGGAAGREAALLLRERFTAAPFAIIGTETVGPAVGASLKRAAITATFFSLLGLVVYIAWRFEFRFGVAAVLCTFHDVLFIVGFIGATQLEFDIPIVAAILTVAGYSVNDTIVVFDRIREKLKTMRREPIEKVINQALAETLVRSFMTGMTTLFAVLAFLFLGPAATRGLNVAILVGIVLGTYSSVFVAAPLLIEWEVLYKRLTKKA